MADRGNLGTMTAATPMASVGTYHGPDASVHVAQWNPVDYLHFGGEDVVPNVPKTSGQIWPRGEP